MLDKSSVDVMEGGKIDVAVLMSVLEGIRDYVHRIDEAMTGLNRFMTTFRRECAILNLSYSCNVCILDADEDKPTIVYSNTCGTRDGLNLIMDGIKEALEQ